MPTHPAEAENHTTYTEDEQKALLFLKVAMVFVILMMVSHLSPPGNRDRLHENPFHYVQPQSAYITQPAQVISPVRIESPFIPLASVNLPSNGINIESAPRLLNGLKPNYILRSRTTKYDLSYENVYYRTGELHLNPFMRTRANWWMENEYSATGKQGCFGDPVGNTEYQMATWFYPCGSIVEVYNPVTHLSVLAEVTDRGPNRFLNIKGWENDRVREYGADITRKVAESIGQKPGEIIYIKPVYLTGENQMFGPAIDLENSPAFYKGIDRSTGNFIGGTLPQSPNLVTAFVLSHSKI